MAKFFCAANPGHARSITVAPKLRAISTVLSVDPESTTTISPAQPTEASVRGRFSASFSVTIATESNGMSCGLSPCTGVYWSATVSSCNCSRSSLSVSASSVSPVFGSVNARASSLHSSL